MRKIKEKMKGEFEMAKGWISLNEEKPVETSAERKANQRKFDNVIRNTKTKKVDELKYDAETAYAKQLFRDSDLIEGYDQKRLKSAKLIKRAKWLKEQRAKAEAANKKAEAAG